jgi:hypothetical protein
LVLIVAVGELRAAPTHEIATDFETRVGDEVVVLPAGTLVEASSGDGKVFTVRHTLSGGAVTLLFVPAASLRAVRSAPPPPQPAPVALPTPAEAPEPAASPSPSPSPTGGVRLATTDGLAAEGRILRVEKRYVVVWDGEGEPVDLPVKKLDSASAALVASWKMKSASKRAEADPRVKPGATFRLVFPDIGESRAKNPAQIEIRIPEGYDPSKPVPVALFLAGGEGGDSAGPAGKFVDPSEWVMVGFPYPKSAPRPLYASRERKASELIEFQKPMLERLEALVPNADPDRRVVIGSSNGAHMIAMAVCDGWKEFTDYFTAFVLHEGGGSESSDFSALRGKDVLFVIGENSESRDFAEWVVDKAMATRCRPDVVIANGEGHGMGDGSRTTIREWIAKLAGD